MDTYSLDTSYFYMAILRVAMRTFPVWMGKVMTSGALNTVTQVSLAIPAGNGVVTVSSESVSLDWSEVTKILMSFPPGCAGLVGARIEYGDTPVYPNDSSSWFIGDDYVFDIPVSGQQNGGTWSVSGYNTDYYDHTIQCWIYWEYINQPVSATESSLVSLLRD